MKKSILVLTLFYGSSLFSSTTLFVDQAKNDLGELEEILSSQRDNPAHKHPLLYATQQMVSEFDEELLFAYDHFLSVLAQSYGLIVSDANQVLDKYLWSVGLKSSQFRRCYAQVLILRVLDEYRALQEQQVHEPVASPMLINTITRFLIQYAGKSIDNVVDGSYGHESNGVEGEETRSLVDLTLLPIYLSSRRYLLLPCSLGVLFLVNMGVAYCMKKHAEEQCDTKLGVVTKELREEVGENLADTRGSIGRCLDKTTREIATIRTKQKGQKKALEGLAQELSSTKRELGRDMLEASHKLLLVENGLNHEVALLTQSVSQGFESHHETLKSIKGREHDVRNDISELRHSTQLQLTGLGQCLSLTHTTGNQDNEGRLALALASLRDTQPTSPVQVNVTQTNGASSSPQPSRAERAKGLSLSLGGSASGGFSLGCGG